MNTNLLLDLPGGIAPGWLPLVDISGNRAEYDAQFEGKATRGEERDVVHFLIADKAQPGLDLFVAALPRARTRARCARSCPPRPGSCSTSSSRSSRKDLATGINKRTRFEFLKRIVITLQTIAGMLDGTMNRNDAYIFSLLGRNLERADMTSRIVDVRSAQLLPAETPELRPFESVQWMSVLKSLSGYQMYRLRMRTRVKRTDVLQFLLRDDQFPRSCQFCLMQLERLAQRAAAQRRRARGARTARRVSSSARRWPRSISPACTSSSTSIQLHINNVHNIIAEIYFPSRDVSGAQRMPASQAQTQSQRQSSLSFGETAKA